LAYKPDVDDTRESPAIAVVKLLVKAGADVLAYEPFKPGERFESFETTNSLEVALANAEAVALLVAHQQFRALEPASIAALTSACIVVDAVNSWDADKWGKAGYAIYTYND